jgi:hypothetical protein
MSTVLRKYPFVSAVTAFLLCIGSVAHGGWVAHGRAIASSPQTILKKMIARYASASSYQDSGEVRVLPESPALANGLGASIQRVSFQDDLLVSFKGYYSNPRMFRFEWKNFLRPTSRVAAVWFDGEIAYSWMPTAYPKNGDGFTLISGTSLRPYLDESTRSAAGANVFVPSLLMKDGNYSSFADMLSFASQLSVVGEEVRPRLK